jgi:hypothetical protein
MNSDDLYSALNFLTRVPVRGFDEEEELFQLVSKIKAQIIRNNTISNVYTKEGTKVA